MCVLQSSAETALWGFSTSCWGSQCSKTNDREEGVGVEMYIVREGEARLNKRRKGEQKKLTRINEAGILFWGQWVGRLLILGQVPQMPITLLLLFVDMQSVVHVTTTHALKDVL